MVWGLVLGKRNLNTEVAGFKRLEPAPTLRLQIELHFFYCSPSFNAVFGSGYLLEAWQVPSCPNLIPYENMRCFSLHTKDVLSLECIIGTLSLLTSRVLNAVTALISNEASSP